MSVPCSGDALNGVVGAGEGRDVRNLVLDGGLTDGAFVLDGVALCPRRVDDEVHLLVQDDIENVRAAFGDLVHDFALDTGSFVELGGAFGSVNLEAELLEFLTDFNRLFREVHLVREANQHSAFGREEGTGGFLALVVSEGVVVGEAEDFTYGDRSAHASLSPSTTRYDESPTAHRERIPGPITGSPSGKHRKARAATTLAWAMPSRRCFCNLSNGNSASLAPWWLNFFSLSLRSSSLAPSIRRVARRALTDRSAFAPLSPSTTR